MGKGKDRTGKGRIELMRQREKGIREKRERDGGIEEL